MSVKLEAISPRLRQISNILRENGQPSYRLREICRYIYRNPQVTSYKQMLSLPAQLRTALCLSSNSDGEISTLTAKHLSPSKQCVKALLELCSDRQSIEAVWMQFKDRAGDKHSSICISSQVGCALKCNFCATGAVGFKRQLTADEIVDQFLYFLKSDGRRVDTISYMGMGEALQNPRVFDSLRILTDQSDGCAISQRRISVSTVGIIPGIKRLTREFPNVNLAFSLHSPFTEQRNVLVPTNKIFPLQDVMAALREHAEQTRRRIFLAYLLLPGVNDSQDHAKAIVELINGMPVQLRPQFHVNLLRYNPAEGVAVDYRRTDRQDMDRFSEHLSARDISFTIRQSFGLDIDAACGQLYKVVNKSNT